VKNGFRNPVKKKPDTHTGGEEHCEPAYGTEVRLDIVATQADISIPAEHKIKSEEKNDVHGPTEEPAGVGGDVCEQRAEEIANFLVVKDGENNESEDDSCGCEKNYGVNIKSKKLFRIFG
jgi:hypothetical protein